MAEIPYYPYIDPALSKRIGLIEGKEELLRTKVFEVVRSGSKEGSRNLLFISRDPGGANCLMPVIKKLFDEFHISMIGDGRGEEMLARQLELRELAVDTPLAADKVINTPDVILASASSEPGIESYANGVFEDVPMVVVEDYYSSSYRFIKSTIEQPGLHLPSLICVMDEAAKRMIVDRFPDISDRVVVTGQPAFDRIALEDTSELSKTTRDELGIDSNDKIISFVSTGTLSADQLDSITDKLKYVPNDVSLIFRKHPRDNTPYSDYYRIFEEKRIKLIKSAESLSIDQISAASDIVMTTWSTVGLEAIYRGKPTIHLLDRRILNVPESIDSIPPATLNASIQIDEINELPRSIELLLDPSSKLSGTIKENIEKYYCPDGRNAERVVSAIRTILGK